MKLVLPEIDGYFSIDGGYINTLIVENKNLFWMIIDDVFQQTMGFDGMSVLSISNEPVKITGNLEIIDKFIGFEINRKPIISKITAALEKNAVNETNYLKTRALLSDIEKSVMDWSFDLNCDLTISKLSVGSLLKAVGVEVNDDYVGAEGRIEQLIGYMELVREFDRNKLFFLVNMRSYFQDSYMEKFFATVLSHQFRVFMLENREYKLLPGEKRRIIDEDLCEI